MSFGQRAALFIVSAIFALLMFAAAIDIGVTRVVGQPKTIEHILDKSGLYSSIVPGLLDEAKTINSSSGSVPLSDPIVQNAAEQTLTPQFLRTNVNQSLDSIYLWLDGKTSQPKFNINLNDVKNSFADKVAAGVKQKVAAFPVCASLPSGNFDAFSASCLPPGVTADQAAAQVRDSITTGQGFLDQSNISASDIKANNSNQSVFADQLKNTPKGYRRFKRSPLILIGLGLLFLIGTIFIADNRRQGIHHAAVMLLGTGVVVFFTGLGINEAIANKVLPGINLSNKVLQSSLRTLIHDVVHNISGSYMLIGVIYVLIGAGAITALRFVFREAVPAGSQKVSAKSSAGS